MFIGIIAGKCLHLVLHILLTRSLSLEDYGIYALVYSLFIIATRISLLGIPVGILKFCSAYNATGNYQGTKGIIRTGFSIIFFSSLVFSAALFIFRDWIAYDFFKKPGLLMCMGIFILFIPVFNLSRACHAVVRAYKKMLAFSVLKEVLFPLVFAIAAIGFLCIDKTLSSVVYAFGTALILTFFISMAAVLKLYFKLPADRMLNEPFKLVRFSLPVFVEGVAYLLLNQMSKILIGFYQLSENVAVFNAAMNLGVLLVIFLNCIDGIFAPYISELHAKNDRKGIEKSFKTTTRWIFTLTAPLFLIYILFPQDILRLFFGSPYAGGSTVLMLLAAGYTINALTGSVTYLLQMTGKQDMEVVNIIIAVAINLILNFFLIPLWGITGAAVATGCSIASLNIIRAMEVYLFFNIHPYDHRYIKPIMSLAVATLIILLIQSILSAPSFFWIVNTVIFGLVYMLMLYLLKFESGDIELVSQLLTAKKNRKTADG